MLRLNIKNQRLNKKDLIEIRSKLESQLIKVPEKIVLLENKWNLGKIISPQILPTINAVLNIYADIIDDTDDDDSYSISGLAFGSGKDILNVIASYRNNIEKAVATQNDQFEQKLNEILSMMDAAYIVFDDKKITRFGPKTVDINEHRIRIEQNKLHSSNHIFNDALNRIAKFAKENLSKPHNFNYLLN